jgi:hypothetical protein
MPAQERRKVVRLKADTTYKQLLLAEISGEVVGEDVDLLVVDCRTVFLHRHHDVAPLGACVVPAQFGDFAQLVARGAGREQDRLAFAVGQFVTWRRRDRGSSEKYRSETYEPARYRITIVMFRFGERPTLILVTSFRATTSTTTTESVFSVAM